MEWNPKEAVDNDAFDSNVDEITTFVKNLKQPVNFFSLDYKDESFEIEVPHIEHCRGHIIA